MLEFALPSSALPLTAPYLRAVLVNDAAEALRLILEEGLGAGVAFGASADALAETCRHLLGLSVPDADGRETA